MGLEQTLVRVEEGFWTGGADYYRQHLAEEARFVFPEVGTMERDAAIAAIADGGRWSSVQFSDVRLLPITETVVWLSYKAAARRESTASTYAAFVGSCYVQGHDGWKLACHQQTIA